MAKESGLAQEYTQHILPFYQHTVTTGQWLKQDNSHLHYAYVIHPDAKGCIVISAGRSEAAIKYAELIYELYHQGYSVFVHDHQGQGLSSRLITNPHIGYVDTFDAYVSDFELMLDEVLQPILQQHQHTDMPLTLLCHSMGCAIGALLVRKRPTVFTRAVFCSPMFGLAAPIPKWLATSILRFKVWLNRWRGKTASYFIGQRDYLPISFDKNRLMSSAVRYRIFKQLYASQTQLQLGGVSCEWLAAALNAMQGIKQHAAEITTPSLVLLAGADTVVNNDDSLLVLADMPDVRTATIAGAKHELLFEADQYRDHALAKIISFIAQ